MEQLRILMLGDVCGQRALSALCAALPGLISRFSADLTIINAENASVNGVTSADARALFGAGADVLTGGNHSFRKSEFGSYLENEPRALRPANFPARCPGAGYGVFPCGNYRALAVNLLGTAFMEPLQNPFECADAILARMAGQYDFALCDFHAEATAEKGAFARDFDGRFALIAGTHTHIPTADLGILPQGTGFVSDLGMCGPENGVLGVRAAESIFRFRTHLPVHYAEGEGAILLQGALFTVDPARAVTLETIPILERLG